MCISKRIAKTYRLDKEIVKLVDKYGKDGKTKLIEQSVPYYIEHFILDNSNTFPTDENNKSATHSGNTELLQQLKEDNKYLKSKVGEWEKRYDDFTKFTIDKIDNQFMIIVEQLNNLIETIYANKTPDDALADDQPIEEPGEKPFGTSGFRGLC
jgi:hypothetical protein